jgi:alginate O-acetyltransferase complex protein AlgJ
VYARFETHWNGRGALVVARAIAAEVTRLTGKPARIDEDRLVWTTPMEPGDLSSLLTLENVIREPFPTVVMGEPKARRVHPGPQLGPTTPALEKLYGVFYSVDDPTLPSAVIHRDSFGTSLLNILQDSFRHSRWLWSREFHTHQVTEVRPDIVILELAERYLEGPPEQVRF